MPHHLDSISAMLKEKKDAVACFAMALASSVLPVPGTGRVQLARWRSPLRAASLLTWRPVEQDTARLLCNRRMRIEMGVRQGHDHELFDLFNLR